MKHKAEDLKLAAQFMEDVAREWLIGSGAGQEMLESTGMSLDATISALFELLNAGLVKMVVDAKGYYSFVPQTVPRPPKAPLYRPGQRFH